ncbi:MAG TPA: hypothetical protein VLW26_10790 [Steroidobacteraceae bacterium]|nr:hypothetical protein [Steroidobacteraceae bacterium]
MLRNWRTTDLVDLGVLRVRGADAETFLQGQLSNDLARIGVGESLLAGYHNPQGRVIAVLRVLRLESQDFLGVLPRELVSLACERLRKFVLRSRVTLSDDSDAWLVEGLQTARGQARAAESPPASEGLPLPIHLHGPSARWLCVRPRSAADAPSADTDTDSDAESVAEARRDWRLQEIASGVAQIYASTSEKFVAQMLNLDLTSAVSLTKGCYTGQEVIARAHYRGRVKRRMQRFLSLVPTELAAGDSGRLADGRSFTVIEAAQHSDGRCEFLAVAPLKAADTSAEAEASEAGATSAEAPSTVAALAVQELALPYSLP